MGCDAPDNIHHYLRCPTWAACEPPHLHLSPPLARLTAPVGLGKRGIEYLAIIYTAFHATVVGRPDFIGAARAASDFA